jgi:hypothetical protein
MKRRIGERNMKRKTLFLATTALTLLLAISWFAVGSYKLLTVSLLGWDEKVGWESVRVERTFAVDDAPRLTVDNFAGAVSVRASESGVIRVIAIKTAPRARNLNWTEMGISESRAGLAIRPNERLNTSIRLEITTPADTHAELGTTFGNVDVRGLSGKVNVGNVIGSVMIADVTGEIHAGSAVAPFIDVHRATGPVHLSAGTGGLRYEGTPRGECSFRVGSGRITLVLPADLNAEIDLKTGGGSIDVEFDVDAQVTGGEMKELKGAIGSGDQAEITALLGGGDIHLVQREERAMRGPF